MIKNPPTLKFKDDLFTMDCEMGQSVMAEMKKFPFSSKLSFAPMIAYWEGLLESEKLDEKILAREVFNQLDKYPFFHEPIEDDSILEKHQDFVHLLLSGFFPSIQRKNFMGAAHKPFLMDPFYRTPALVDFLSSGQLNIHFDMEMEVAKKMRVVKACCYILNQHYNQKIELNPSFIYTLEIEGTSKIGHFKSLYDKQFIKIIPTKPLKKLSQEQINQLLRNVYDTDLWLSMLPPENFEFHGIGMERLIDITQEETISQMKYKLLEKDAIVQPENIKELEKDLKTYFDIPDLRLGITALDYPSEFEISHRYKIRYDFLAKKHDNLLSENNQGSLYEKVCKWNTEMIIEDLNKYEDGTTFPQDLMAEGIKSIIVTPLVNKDNRVIGILEIGAPQAFQLNSFHKLKLKAVAPLFSMSLLRSREEIDNRIEAIMREQFTAMHPSVEWKFIEEAFEIMEKREIDPDFSNMKPIGFENIYPLYGQADIVGSSHLRNVSIQTDLVENLNLIKNVFNVATKHITFPLLDLKLLEVEKNIKSISKGITSDDETRVLEFIKNEIHPLFEEVKDRNPEVEAEVISYLKKLDPDFGFLYQDRKKYEESVAKINDMISWVLNDAEKEGQKMIPHYFDEYKTDGVEYDIYIGQSLLKQGKFREMHLHNLRLWQLMTMVEVTRKVEKLKATLEAPLDTAQLIFVYGNPLSIVFRLDEKRFDVDGAYNVRYEIIKKRIDKATIEGTGERLTVKGKIAIAYTSEKDKTEYLGYLNFLKEKKYITGKIEDLTLSKMQGVEGLRALRVTVVLE
ncbi:MAG: GAF domain-containing protein [Saprospiraceae bacterium]